MESLVVEEELNEFKAGEIHEQRFKQFWIENLNPSKWVLDVLEDGYTIPFYTEPEDYCERNNKSVRENMQIVRQIVADMVAKGIVKICKEKPKVVSRYATLNLQHRTVHHQDLSYRYL
jgi:hypothetical protein